MRLFEIAVAVGGVSRIVFTFLYLSADAVLLMTPSDDRGEVAVEAARRIARLGRDVGVKADVKNLERGE